MVVAQQPRNTWYLEKARLEGSVVAALQYCFPLFPWRPRDRMGARGGLVPKSESSHTGAHHTQKRITSAVVFFGILFFLPPPFLFSPKTQHSNPPAMSLELLQEDSGTSIKIMFASGGAGTYTLRHLTHFSRDGGILRAVSAALLAETSSASPREVAIQTPIEKDVFETVLCLAKRSSHTLGCSLDTETLYRVLAAIGYLSIASSSRRRFYKNLAKKSVLGVHADDIYACICNNDRYSDVTTSHEVPVSLYCHLMAGVLAVQGNLGFGVLGGSEHIEYILCSKSRTHGSKYSYSDDQAVPNNVRISPNAARHLTSKSPPAFWKALAWCFWHAGIRCMHVDITKRLKDVLSYVSVARLEDLTIECPCENAVDIDLSPLVARDNVLKSELCSLYVVYIGLTDGSKDAISQLQLRKLVVWQDFQLEHKDYIASFLKDGSPLQQTLQHLEVRFQQAGDNLSAADIDAISKTKLVSLEIYDSMVLPPQFTNVQEQVSLRALGEDASPISRSLDLLSLADIFLHHENLAALSGLHLSTLELCNSLLAQDASFSVLLAPCSALKRTLKTLHIKRMRNLQPDDMDAISRAGIEKLCLTNIYVNKSLPLLFFRREPAAQNCKMRTSTTEHASPHAQADVADTGPDKDGADDAENTPDRQSMFNGRLRRLCMEYCKASPADIAVIADLELETLELTRVLLAPGSLAPLWNPDAPLCRTLKLLSINVDLLQDQSNIHGISQLRLDELEVGCFKLPGLAYIPLGAPESVLRNRLRRLTLRVSDKTAAADIEAISNMHLEGLELCVFHHSLPSYTVLAPMLAPILGESSVLKHTIRRFSISPREYFSEADLKVFDDVQEHIAARTSADSR